MTNIAYLIPEFPGQTHAFFMRERNELKRRGIRAKLFSTRPPKAGAAAHDWAAEAEAETTYLTPLTLSSWLNAGRILLKAGPRAWFECLKIICVAAELTTKQRLRLLGLVLVAAQLVARMAAQRCEHIHIHSCADAAWLGLFASKLAPVSYSLTLHGPLHDYGPNQHLKWRSASFVVVITKDLIDQAMRVLPADEMPPLELAPMGVELDRFCRSRPYHPARPDDVLRIVSCGRLNPCKGHDDLLRAVAELRDRGLRPELRICGATDGAASGHAAELRALASQLGLVDHVVFLGSISEREVKQTLEDAHVFALASHKEPLGVATMEAMAMQLPVVVTNSPGVREMIVDGVHGQLVEPKSPTAIADAVADLVTNPNRCLELGRSARERIERDYHSGRSAEVIAARVTLRKPSVSSQPSAVQPVGQASGEHGAGHVVAARQTSVNRNPSRSTTSPTVTARSCEKQSAEVQTV